MGKQMSKQTVTVDLELPDVSTGESIDPEMSVLLVVDLQNESCHPNGVHYSGPEGMQVVQATNELVKRFRASKGRIIWLQSVRTPEQAIFSVYGKEPYRIDGSWNVQITPPLEPIAGERIIRKHTHNCFINTDLEAHLRREGIVGTVWNFVVVGGSLTTCLLEAIKGLSMRDYRVFVPMDCVRPKDGPGAMVALYQLGQGTYPYNVRFLDNADDISLLRNNSRE